MTPYDIKEFVYLKMPLGAEVAELIEKHSLQSYGLESISKELVTGTNFSTGYNNYTWTVRFRKKIT